MLKQVVTILGILTVVVIGGADYLTGYRLAFSIFYLIPISFVTWKTGRHWGYLIAAASAVAWFVADLKARGSDVYYMISCWNGATRLAFFMIIVLVLSKKEAVYLGEKSLARTDALTGARNRHAFNELLEKEISRHQRFGHPFSIAFIDCDRFKELNDKFGHRTGDILLQKMAETTRRNMRTMDVLARMGGDEFVVLMPEAEKEDAREAMERLRGLFQGVMKDNEWPVTLSIGIATFIGTVNSVDEAIEKADSLMYSAKNKGRDRIIEGVF